MVKSGCGEEEMLKSRFRSRTEHTLDSKGRLNFPRRFCDVLGQLESQTLMIAPFKNHLRIYPIEEWESLETKLLTGGGQHARLGNWVRYVVGGVVECNVDKQGRILIPQALRAEASLQKEIVLNGMLSWIEIWDAGAWAIEHQTTLEGYEAFADSLAQIGIL